MSKHSAAQPNNQSSPDREHGQSKKRCAEGDVETVALSEIRLQKMLSSMHDDLTMDEETVASVQEFMLRPVQKAAPAPASSKAETVTTKLRPRPPDEPPPQYLYQCNKKPTIPIGMCPYQARRLGYDSSTPPAQTTPSRRAFPYPKALNDQ